MCWSCSFITSQEIRKYESFKFYSAKFVLAILGPWLIHIPLRNSSSVSTKHLPGFGLECFESLGQFEENRYLNNIESFNSIHEHNTSLHLIRLSLLSFMNALEFPATRHHIELCHFKNFSFWNNYGFTENHKVQCAVDLVSPDGYSLEN